MSSLSSTSSSSSSVTNAITLCIPRVLSNISEAHIRSIFEHLELGIIRNIDILSITNQTGKMYNRVFVHFTSWFNNNNAHYSLTRLNEGKEIKIMYDDPWFWKVSLYKKKEHRYPYSQQNQQNQQNQTMTPPRPSQDKMMIDYNQKIPPRPQKQLRRNNPANYSRNQYNNTRPVPIRLFDKEEEKL
jgi:hypothetical protein